MLKFNVFVFAFLTLLSVPTSNAILYARDNSFYKSHLFFNYESNIWKAINRKFDLHGPSNNQTVRKQITWFLRHPEEIHDLTYHSSPYIYYIFQEVKKRGLPPEIALLPMIESDYNPMGSSNRSAAGLWQLRPSTARGLGVHINDWYDGRRDIVASTNAALNYLQYLHNYFHNWLLAFAAYNSGIGTVTRALKYNKAHNRPMDFWSLPLPHQTRAYVPKLLAISTILSNPKTYNLHAFPVANEPYFTSVQSPHPISLHSIAKLTNTNIKTIHKLNPGIRSLQEAPNHKYNFLIPVTQVKKLELALQQQTIKVNRHVSKKPLTKPVVLAHNSTKITHHVIKHPHLKYRKHHRRHHHYHTRLAVSRRHHLA